MAVPRHRRRTVAGRAVAFAKTAGFVLEDPGTYTPLSVAAGRSGLLVLHSPARPCRRTAI